ncbi:iron chelate uptake ABC transporter family permease subunit [uncultured Tyzzerella sp.]|uniref:iron chelate uptake ABC transporter family permease subunit n=1 Tax=uncultured Tyzzerella sp. TaxID=2321398 RepID=UPI0029439C63|nr:iron chelate uptake ABC transporter family permease subunit [uncultured Tyzzerella sp.]
MSNKKKIFILTILIVIACSISLFLGVNESNIGYFLPKRANKILAIAISSFCIGYSTVSFQTITNNRILTPSVIGLDSLYMFLQTVIVYFFGSKTLSMLSGYSNYFLSIGFMVLFSLILFIVLFLKENRNLYFLILSGMIVGNLFGGMTTFMQVVLDPNEFFVLQGKMFASFSNVNEELLFISILIILVVFVLTIKNYSTLDVLSLGKDHAINLGINYNHFVLKNLIVISILVAVSTALTGPITFLGILVASISRELMKTYKHTYRILCSVLIGFLFLIVGQFLVEKVFSFNTTIGTIINFIGGLYFIYLILTEAKR